MSDLSTKRNSSRGSPLPATLDKATINALKMILPALKDDTVAGHTYEQARAQEQDGHLAVTSGLRESFRQNHGEFMAPSDPRFMHGWLYRGPMTKPNVLWKSDKKPRKDHAAPDWLTATEFEDGQGVMSTKAKQLAQLIRISRRTVVYSGAGISASAVGQAALSGVNKTGWVDKTSAKPTMTHHALAVLGNNGWIHGWVQQNHDGLPQKAGFPQDRICEIHGSWYDPSNPVIKYSGSLKAHEAAWMESEMEQADLVLVLGTSLGGLNADQVVTECAVSIWHLTPDTH